VDKHDLTHILNEIGLLLEIKDDNPFKSRAYYNAARILENLNEDLSILIQQERLSEVPGFGDTLVKKINEWAETGTIAYYENLKAEIPLGLLELLRIPGLGPRKINQIYNRLGITSIAELERACLENRLAALPGFGVKTQEKICAGIQFIEEHHGKYLLVEAMTPALTLRDNLAENPAVQKVELAGSIRRFKEIVHDLDLVVATDQPNVVAEFFKRQPQIEQVSSAGDTKVSVILKSGIAADLRLVNLQEYPHALQHFSGSKEHNTKLRHIAKERGYKVNEYGLFKGDAETGKAEYCTDEAGIYQSLGLSFIPPELREDIGEIEAAQTGSLPVLVRPEDLKGIFHVHTTYSDGSATLRNMVTAALKQGFSYIGISDHSQIAVYAHGLTAEKLRQQWAEIDVLQQEFPDIKVFKGVEADILASGELDYNSEILAQFDFVIASIHSQFRMGYSEMTGRILKAMDNPYLTMLGHPTGRILLGRPGYELDLDAMIAKAAERNIIIEFNASPYRFDLDWRWCKKAKEQGVLIAINPDAHNENELNLVNGGIMIARKGWLTARDVLNTRSRSEIEDFLFKRKNQR
jgi:DNA polymerase IV (family X)